MVACAASVFGATFTVTKTVDTNGTCNSGVDCSLREAINAANDEANHPGADIIVFAVGVSGTINLSSALPTISTDITLQGPGPNLLAVNRAAGAFSIFTISNGSSPGPTVSISGIAITNGHAAGAGALGSGGGVLALGRLTISNCTLSGNTADIDGGAIATGTNAMLTVSDCTFSNNTAGGHGGGIITIENAIVSSSTFSGNKVTSASGQGGAIFIDGTLSVVNCTLNGNSAATGGGIYSESVNNNVVTTVTVSSSTLSGNSGTNGGGIYNTGSSGGNSFVNVDNTILQKGASGANLVNTGLGTSVTSQGYNLSDDDGGGFLTAAGDQKNTNPQLGPLQNNGGPTFTMALLTGSPAQDKGKNSGVMTDQRGLRRPIDIASIPNANGGDGSDIGAVEMDTLQTGPTFVVTTTADHDEGSCSVGDCTLREAINVSNSDPAANSITFNSGVTGTITLQSALPAITDSVTITGPGARVLSVSGNSASRVFFFSSGSSAISGLTIRDGNATTATSGNGMRGGGIFNAGNATLTISDCTLYNNHVQGANNTTTASGAGGFGDGGAICNSGNLTVSRCTLVGNSAMGGSGADASGAMGANLHGGDGGTALGAAIFNDTTGTLTMSDSTVATNLATGGAAGKGQFGGNGGAGGSSGVVICISILVFSMPRQNCKERAGIATA